MQGDTGPTQPDDSALARRIAAIEEHLAALGSTLHLRARRLELVDENGAVRIRIGYLGEDDVIGMECLHRNGTLGSFFGLVAGDGSVSFTGGRYDNIVLELGADDDGAHLRVIDPADPTGGRAIDMTDFAGSPAGEL